MSLDPGLTRACPFLLESDILSLSPDFRLRSNVLYDTVLDIQHVLHASGAMPISLLVTGVSYQQLLGNTREQRIQDLQVSELLGFLNKIGGLRLTRVNSLQGYITQGRHLLLGTRYMSLSRRRKARFLHISIATLRAITPVILATGVVSGLIWVAGFAMLLQALSTAAASLVLFFTSIVVHENTHVWVLKRNDIDADVLQMGMRIGIIHAAPGASLEIASSIAGPLSGVGICTLAVIGAGFWGPSLLSFAGILIGLLHVLSLLPVYGDGQSLIKALRERKKQREKYS